jgi:putative phage-type endonuclease
MVKDNNILSNRHLYIGSSDIATIMGLNKFKTRFDLLLEKAQLTTNTFDENEYSNYGDLMEPKIRKHLNQTYNINLQPNTIIKDNLRDNSDGTDKENNIAAEIKTTSYIKKTIKGYRHYLVQLLFHLVLNEVDKGLLAVYKRPKDFDTNFNKEYLQTFEIDIKDYQDLLNEIEIAVDKFLKDLDKVKNNPLIEEWEL